MNSKAILALARREFRYLRTTKGVAALLILQSLFTYRAHEHVLTMTRSDEVLTVLGGRTPLVVLQAGVSLPLFFAGLLIGYRSIVSERTDGSLLLTASQPIRRWELILGKVLGRTSVILLPTAVLAVLYLLLGSFVFQPPNLLLLAVLAIATVAYAGVCVSIGVGISTLADNQGVVGVITFGLLFCEFLWTNLSRTLYATLTGTNVNWFSPPASGPLFMLERAFPVEAYTVPVNWLFGLPNSSSYGYMALADSLETASNTTRITTTLLVGEIFNAQSIPLYLEGWFSAIILGLWCLSIGFMGVLRFSMGDL
jgi:ABC-2 type transport system permease protein